MGMGKLFTILVIMAMNYVYFVNSEAAGKYYLIFWMVKTTIS